MHLPVPQIEPTYFVFLGKCVTHLVIMQCVPLCGEDIAHAKQYIRLY